MLNVNSYDRHVAACLLDFFGAETPWQRKLWAVGAVMGIREVLEGGEALQSGVLSQKSFEDLCHSLKVAVGKDPGAAGSREERQLLQASLGSCPRPGSVDYLIVQELLSQIEEHYLDRWRLALQELTKSTHGPRPERTARAIATHLLDLGFSAAYLHPWWKFRIFHEEGSRSLADLVEDACDLVRQRPPEFEILVPLLSSPGVPTEVPVHWRDPQAVSQWFRENDFDSRNLRQTGGLLFKIQERDVNAAVEQVSEIVERLAARVNLGTSSGLRTAGRAWVRGYNKHRQPYPLRRIERRGVEIPALSQENQLYSVSATSDIDAALELLGSLNEAPLGPAVASGWAAIEALLLGPGDSGSRGIAGDRLASLIACSFPRAELTALVRAHMESASDPLAYQLKKLRTNRERIELLTEFLLAGHQLVLPSESDRLAESRISALLSSPRSSLRDIEEHAIRALRRMYRQRNLVLHWGRMNAVCLRASLRTAAPLIGAGIDRIVHAWFSKQTSPLELAARARIRLEWLETPASIPVFELLDP